MATGSLIETVRFGYGPGLQDQPDEAMGFDPSRLLAQLAPAAPLSAGAGSPARLALLAEQRRAREIARSGGPKSDEADVALHALVVQDGLDWIWQPVTRKTGFAERLVNFWANRLSIATRKGAVAALLGPYREEAIRPHVAGRFAEMLAASAWHPAMLEYLDQAASVGPDSEFGRRRRRGLNENYAREFLELHSMGSGYSQADVTELAGLFAGMTYGDDGSFFDETRAQPGPKTVLDTRYGSGPEEIARLIETVARRPETAASLALALARHFIADDPPAALVDRLAQVYLQADTALLPVYAALLDDPAAADPVLHKIRSPHEFIVASIRTLGLGPELATGKGGLRTRVALETMGQPTFAPAGPDGWPDQAEDWLTAPALAARLNWAEGLARGHGRTSEPALLARRVLGGQDADTIMAAGRAEQRWEGLAILFASPAFMRR